MTLRFQACVSGDESASVIVKFGSRKGLRGKKMNFVLDMLSLRFLYYPVLDLLKAVLLTLHQFI